MMQTYAAGRMYNAKEGIIADLSPNNVIIECAKLTLRNRAVDIDVDIYPHQLNNIDTIVINGHTYKKEEV